MYLQDVTGRTIRTISYENVNGSPYSNSEWRLGEIILADSKTYRKVRLKYDQLNDEILFKTKELIADNVKEFKFAASGEESDSTTFRNVFRVYKTYTANSFYQVLNDGKTKLLKKVIKSVKTDKANNAAHWKYRSSKHQVIIY